jgi:hypothetical protein
VISNAINPAEQPASANFMEARIETWKLGLQLKAHHSTSYRLCKSRRNRLGTGSPVSVFKNSLSCLFSSDEKRSARISFGPPRNVPAGIASAIVEVDNIFECCGLAVAEERRGLGDLTKALRAPEPRRNGLAAKIAIACSLRGIAKMSIYIEVSIRGRPIADEGLVGRAPAFGGIGMRREFGVDAQANVVEIVIGKERSIMAMDTACFADEELETLLRFRRDCIAIAGNEAVESAHCGSRVF